MQQANDAPDLDTMLRTLRGEATGWSYRFSPPPVCTTFWTAHDWARYIGRGDWFRVPAVQGTAHAEPVSKVEG
jgi:hypothetical protein